MTASPSEIKELRDALAKVIAESRAKDRIIEAKDQLIDEYRDKAAVKELAIDERGRKISELEAKGSRRMRSPAPPRVN